MLTYGFAQFGQYEQFNVRIQHQPENEPYQEVDDRTDGNEIEEESHFPGLLKAHAPRLI